MKRILGILLLTALLVFSLTGCEIEPPPAVEEARFNFSVTYEHLGERETISGVFVCKYTGLSWSIEGGDFTRGWEGHIEGIEHAGEVYNSAVLICKTDDGGDLYLDFSLGAAHMMGEPHLADAVIEPAFFHEYSNEDHTSSSSGASTEEIEELFGYKIVDYQYDPPIQNSFSFFG